MSAHVKLSRERVVVLSGGTSSEREVSLRTGAAISRALRASSDGAGPLNVLDVEIESDGAWRVVGERLAPAAAIERCPSDALYFLALHGGEGEDGTVQGLLRSLRRAHTGSGVFASALCMNKSATRAVLAHEGLRIARGIVVDAHAWSTQRSRLADDLGQLSEQGWAVKPRSGGSSVATSVVLRAHDLAPAIERALATGDAVLVEERIVGREATCGVLGNASGAKRALPVVEIVPKDGRFFDYEEKYSSLGAAEFCPPRSISPATCERIRALALRAHTAAGCDGYSRVDFLVPVDASGREDEPVVLEINTLPGMTDRSLLPQAAAADGVSFRELCLEILGLALERSRA